MIMNTALYRFIPLRRITQYRHYASKISSDEKLLESILEESENEVKQSSKSNSTSGSSSYRSTSNLANFSQNNGNENKNIHPPDKLPIGPKYWKNKFRKSYRKVEKGLITPLDEYVSRNIDVIESYNKKYKKSVEERIKVNINKTLEWEDVISNNGLRSAIIRYLSEKWDGQKISLTSFQQRFFALMSGYASTIAKGPSGCGKSFSILVSALTLRRSVTRGKGINSLILVKSNALVHQYERIINGILSKMGNKTKTDSRNIAQFLYRGTPEEEMKQDDDLTDYQTPHILVATPQRLLDILSSKGMDFMKINALAYIAVDDFTSMIDENNLLETDRKAPVVELLDYVLKLQDYRRHHNDPHPQVVLIADNFATEQIILQLKEYTKWFDWRKFAPIGKFGDDEDVPYYKYVSDKSYISTILVYPRFMQNDDTKKLESKKYKVTLYDMQPFHYGNTPNEWLTTLYRKSFGNSLVYKKHRNANWTNVPKDVKNGELDILCSGLGKLLKKKDVTTWLANKRGLIVHPDEVNSRHVVDILSTKTGRKVKIFDPCKDGDIFKTTIKNDDDVQLLVINSSSLIGLTLPGLDSLFILGVNSIKSEMQLGTLIGRTRNLNGLIPEEEYSMFSYRNDSKERPRSRTFIITAMLPDGTVDPYDRNFLERSYIVNGLIHQTDAIGVNEKWTDENKKEYAKVIEGSSIDEGMNIDFNGFNINYNPLVVNKEKN